MPLRLYNTLTRRVEPFEPLEPGVVKMYACGVTVYDYSHVGHARNYIAWDTLRRYLLWRGYAVKYVQNFTDIDDKIIRRSHQENVPWTVITETYIQAYLDDMDRLNIRRADVYPKATEVVPQIVEFIQSLIDRGYAYESGGDVYYAVEKFPSYGKLSGRKLDQMEAGASGRVDEEAAKKHHPLDFALWKAAKPGEPEWDSPWGKGRPGWHIECSVMVREELGDSIDIHTGGQDLIFPHHENEIAQSEAALSKPLSRFWLHNGFVNISGEKMSKSLGNFTTIRQMLESGFDPMVLRLFVLQAQYRKPIDFTEEAIASAQNAWDTLTEGLRFGYKYGAALGFAAENGAALDDPATLNISAESDAVQRFQAAMDDDLNTPVALSVLFELAKELQKEGNRLTHDGKTLAEPAALQAQWQTLVALAEVLGLTVSPDAAPAPDGLSDAEIEALVQQRAEAKRAKNWAEGDRIRDELKAQGITLIDKPGGVTEWIRGS
ncbi:cysteine--tRNA ligase [Thermoleptolyngbya sp. C42_A2020_037]|uniref:cysteine--tRNA ligase n=1 Tax=Thermoleptolyngbya sp. C42_A2020_037 TaxID=2747799 RepID=UPI0019E9E7A9|nr:cysteine--tRNA ligase [Thermoleptolyngbya sp. C42_A2020_037]MBF2086119.1 cysteine--tRNA ligase [Thermoleptolyngbya sp. C42_A2020_037]